MVHARHRVQALVLAAAAFVLPSAALASDGTPVAAFGTTVAAQWSGHELSCPAGSYDWLGATPDTLFCFRVDMSGLSIRARLSGHLEEQGIWLNAWTQETPELSSRPFWADGALFRFVVGTSLAAPRSAVVFILHAAID